MAALRHGMMAGALAAGLMVFGSATAAIADSRGPAAGDWRPVPGLTAHVGRGLDRLLDRVDATEDEAAAIRAIWREARAEAMPLMVETGQALAEMRALLAAETIDTDAVEALRQRWVADFDAASARMVAAMVEAAEVLPPEKRAEFVAGLGPRGPRGSRH